MSPSLHDFLNHILAECDYVLRVTKHKSYNEFLDDETLTRAVVRSLEIIGEATKKLPEEFTLNIPQIDWADIAGMRDILIHNYYGVDYEIVWSTITKNIPELQTEIRRNISD